MISALAQERNNNNLKAAMAEGLANKANDPSDRHVTLYNTWSYGGWGAVITGTCQIWK